MNSESFHVKLIHFTLDQTKLLNRNQRLIIYPTNDFKDYLNRIVSRFGDDIELILASFLHQSEKHLTTFIDINYTSENGKIRTMLVETHIFIFRRIKNNEGQYIFIPKEDII